MRDFKPLSIFIIIMSVIAITSCSDLNKNNYKPILDDNARFDYLFNSTLIDSIAIEYSFGNDIEKLFAYNMRNNSRIIIYELGGLKNISLDTIIPKNISVDYESSPLPFAGADFGNPFVSIKKNVDVFTGNKLEIYNSTYDDLELSYIDSNTVIFVGKTDRFIVSNKDNTHWIDFSYKEGAVLTEIILHNQHDKMILMVVNPMFGKTYINDWFLNKDYLFCDIE